MFQRSVTVRFHEVDRAGIVFFGRAFEYCHIVFEDVLAEIFGDPAAPFDGGWGLPLVHADADYSKPMRLGEKLTVGLEVERLGDRSITFAYSIEGADGELRARAHLVHAFVDLSTFEARSAPPELVEGLGRLGLLPSAPQSS